MTFYTQIKGLLPWVSSCHLFNKGAYFCSCTGSAHYPRHSKTHTHPGVDIDAINYATKYMTKMKAKFPSCDQIKFNEPALKPGREEIAVR